MSYSSAVQCLLSIYEIPGSVSSTLKKNKSRSMRVLKGTLVLESKHSEEGLATLAVKST